MAGNGKQSENPALCLAPGVVRRFEAVRRPMHVRVRPHAHPPGPMRSKKPVQCPLRAGGQVCPWCMLRRCGRVVDCTGLENRCIMNLSG